MLRSSGTLLAAAASALALLLPPAGPVAAEQTTQVHTDEVCLPVHNPGDGNPQTLAGVRFWTRPVTAASRTIVLVHGAHTADHYWDWSPGFSAARNLARAGYLVLAYYRLGYEHSPYRTGDGNQITPVGGQQMLHDVVDDVHHGTWTTAAGGACSPTAPGPVAGGGTSSVILVGNSLGGSMVAGYPGHYHDVDAIVPIGWAHTGATPAGLGVIYLPTVAAAASAHDRVVLTPDEASCTAAMLYRPAVPPAAQNFCAGGMPSIPIGDMTHLQDIYPNNLPAIAATGPTPVLLVYGDHDVLFTHEQEEAEFAYWRSVCGCDVEEYFQPDAGHGTVLHRSMPQLTARIVSFLAEHKLVP